MLGKRLIKTSAGAACTTDTVQILDGVPFQSIATYELDGDATNLVETGYINKAGVFNGSSSRINLPSNPINGLSSVSFSFWIKPNDIASYQYVLSFINSVDGWNGLGIRITNTGKIQVVRANSGAVTTTENSTTTLSLNVWQHVAVSVQQSGAVIYINGSPDGTFSSTPFTTNNTGSFDIGMNEYASGVTQAFTNGSIDQVRIFNRVITANEVTTLYGETSASSTKSTTDIFADSSGLALYEFEGNANDTGGTYNGTATNVVYNEYDGTASNVTYSTGKFGQAGVFNGSSSKINLPTISNIKTYSFWINPDSTGNSVYARRIFGDIGGTSYTNSITFDPGVGKIVYYEGTTARSGDTVPYNAWTHIALTSDGTTLNIYTNGTLSNTYTTSGFISSIEEICSTSSNRQFKGSIDQVRIYDKAISAADVTTLYNETVATASTNITLELPSLVAYYKMNDATDETGSYDGTPTNVNFNVAGKFGNAGEFNGSSSKINIPNSAGNNMSTFSISFWFKTSGHSGTATLINNGGADSTQAGWYLGLNASGNLFFTTSQGGVNAPSTTGTTNYEDSSWHNVVLVYNAIGAGTSTYNVYVDGNSTPEITGTNGQFTTTATQPLTIGRFARVSIEFFNGSIDQVRIFDRAITANEVTKLYNEVECIPTIVPTDHFNPVLYTGTGSGSKSVTGVGFEPDLVWGKARNANHPHVIFDIVRGENKQIQPNEASVEVTRASDAYLFDPDGFTVTTAGNLNNAFNYVAWNWKAGGAAVSNTDGTITSQVSANTDAGFSIVSYTGNQSSSTIGHGLSQAPEMIIAKSRTVAQNWAVYHKDAGSNYWLQLNGTIAKIDEPVWNDTTPTDSVFSMNGNVIINKSGSTNIAYCFHSVDGMSKFGSYVGTGAAGNSIVTGFRPAFVMFKSTSNDNYWYVLDNKRNTSNPINTGLFPNDSLAEITNSSYNVDFNSNGFTLQNNTIGFNQSGYDYIFMAFAEENVEPQPVLANSFNTVLYTGNGSTQAINTVGFQPDLVWIKKRGPSTGNHLLQNTIQGAGTGSALSSNSTGAAGNFDQYGYISAFDTNGFTLQGGTSGSYPHDNANENNSTYVAWNWKASNDSTINQEGSITSIVSANPAAGFSVVKYTGNGASGSTIGHGLSDTPQMMISKRTDSGDNWNVYTEATGNTGILYLNLTDAFTTVSNRFNNTSPTSTVFTVGNSPAINVSGGEYIAYCFHSVDGFSKIGSYIGTGATGNAQNIGFEPSFVMVKSSSNAEPWFILDNKRDPNNPRDNRLMADSSAAEDDGSVHTMDFTSNGFTLNGTVGNGTNGNNVSYIYLAIKAN